jgi:hypothetical protein
VSELAVTPELVERLAGLVGLALPAGDLEPLQLVLVHQVASAEALRSLELDDVEPIVSFDPRWS